MQQLAGQGNLAIMFPIAITIFLVAVLFVSRYAYRKWREDRASSRDNSSLRDGTYWRATVGEVIDGETVLVFDSERKLTLRLDSIACPPHGRYCSEVARSGLAELIDGKDIFYQAHMRDDLGRVVSTIFALCDGHWTNINVRMVGLGHAWVKRADLGHLSSERQDELERMERSAKTCRLGLWGAVDPVPPGLRRNGSGLDSAQRRCVH
jgi:endonuclease YncB( thermonuclease family)